MYNEKFMDLSIKQAEVTMNQNIGGPFGACIVKDGEIICITNNTVLGDNDPTAHAEMNAIRQACKKLGTYDLSGCELYATGYPCPMCMSAIIWANIKTVYICNDVKLAEQIGFRDDFIYDFIKSGCNDPELVNMAIHPSQEGVRLYHEYAKMNKVIY